MRIEIYGGDDDEPLVYKFFRKGEEVPRGK